MYHNNFYVEQQQLRHLEQCQLPFDIAFFVAQRRRDIRLAEKSSMPPGTLTMDGHVKLDILRAKVNRIILVAREQQVRVLCFDGTVGPGVMFAPARE